MGQSESYYEVYDYFDTNLDGLAYHLVEHNLHLRIFEAVLLRLGAISIEEEEEDRVEYTRIS